MSRYETRKVPLTALQKRFFPGDADKPFVIWDKKQDRPTGRRYGTQSGADAAVGTKNRADRAKKESRT